MATSILSVRMDDEIKKGFESFCQEVGMNATTAVNIFARAVLREQRIPFEIAAQNSDPFYSAENQARLARAAYDMDRFGGTPHELIEPDHA